MAGVSAVVLAAGTSTRMGGPNKLLLPWNGTTVVAAVVGALRECIVDIVVVTGRDSDEVANAVSPSTTVFNENYEQGLGTSIAKGVAACPEENAILITLGDMPALKPETVDRLIENYQDRQDIVVPVYSEDPDRHGHPVLFGASHRFSLAGLRGSRGAKTLIDEQRLNLRQVNISGRLSDIDEPDDLHQSE